MKAKAAKLLFLRTFDPSGEQNQQPPAVVTQGSAGTPVAPALPPGEAVIPASALPAMLAAFSTQGAAAQKELLDARSQLEAAKATNQPKPAPTLQKEKIDQVSDQVQQLFNELQEQKLENYRLQAISSAKAAGLQLSELMVVGRTTAEIDASVKLAIAEYQLIASQVAKQIETQLQAQQQQMALQAQQAQLQAAQQAAQQQAPQAQVSQLGGQPISAPSFMAAPAPAPQNQAGYSPEQISLLTSPEALRSGDYAKHREELHRQLRGAGRPQQLMMPTTPQFAPPVPAPQLAPAIQLTNFAGVQQPQIPSFAPVQSHPSQLSFGLQPYPGTANPVLQQVQQPQQVDPAAAAQAAILRHRQMNGNSN